MALHNPMDLSSLTVLVTGASSGIGRQTSILLSQLGARVVLVARRAQGLEETVSLLNGTGHTVRPFDLTDVDAIPQFLKDISRDTGPLHAVVHSAGVHVTRSIRMQRSGELESLMRVNLGAAFGLARGFRQRGVCGAEGRLVFLSSVMGIVGQPAVTAYAASKGALLALTKSLALELANEGIRVNCVVPGQVKTEMAERIQDGLPDGHYDAIERMHPLGLGTVVDVAYAVAFLVARTGRWITGSALVVDGGYTAH
jgi:3-oxoacyl-[acyl-carrier protein] reductase